MTVQMQTILEFLYVQSEFGRVGENHQSLISTMKRMELALGRNLGLYPISANVLKTQAKNGKMPRKPYRPLPVRVIHQRLLSYEVFKPRLLSVIEHS
ncbi:unnamed protein product [Echinostoma caproni]|uniref:Transposase n=1 Tax=Echinostoma caproni TaxID=27848 RepID=A0A183B8K2_9TREM|nr:unnamed protein product [Echinostoma caproni]